MIDEFVKTRSKERNQNKYRIIRIGIFGSAARDTMKEQSDIDVVKNHGFKRYY
ncbi:MAG: nucleotidyltransferase domain-containing protein [Proteobacteria bacterium]|nr:nucleotidyltransferase domain-containing protein [Pseudomonadota bacterium]